MKALVLCVLLGPALASADEWGLGLRATGERVDPHDDATAQGIGMGGGGLLLRWRLGGLFGLELAVDGFGGKLADGAFERNTSSVGLTAQFHLNPGSRWDWYLLAGLAGVDDKVKFRDVDGNRMEQEFKETEIRLGGGLEYRWPHIGLGGELAAVALARNDGDDALIGDAVPKESGGAQLSITFAYYF